MWTIRTRIGWGLLVTGTLLLAAFASRYLTFDSETYFPRQRLVYERETLGLAVHIVAMLFATLIGPFQFLRAIREGHPRVHRLLGRVYVVSASVGAMAGLYMAQFAASGARAGVGFAFLGVGVLLTTGMAFREVRSRRFDSHRDWMTRSFALIFAAVTLRLYLPFLEAAFGEDDGYAIVAWLCWIPNLLVAEWIVRSRRRPEAQFAAQG